MPGIRITVADGRDGFDRAAADAIGSALGTSPRAAVVVATGRTPMGAYARLADDLSTDAAGRLRVFQLDEYLGIPPSDPRSLASWTRRSFVEPLGIDPASVEWFDAMADDADAECRRYERAVAEAGGFDLAVLGLGPNGHLGFNEPPSDPTSGTRVVPLSEASLASNAAYVPGYPVPSIALTAGLDLLLAARRVVLVVSGRTKREIVHRALEGPVTAEVPASFLQEHPELVVVVDADAWGA
jgi:glucosamine-6-phosphate deaminase